jgi:hypothetical protein
MLKELLGELNSLIARLENFEPKTDTQALLSIDMHNALARAQKILSALANEPGVE